MTLEDNKSPLNFRCRRHTETYRISVIQSHFNFEDDLKSPAIGRSSWPKHKTLGSRQRANWPVANPAIGWRRLSLPGPSVIHRQAMKRLAHRTQYTILTLPTQAWQDEHGCARLARLRKPGLDWLGNPPPSNQALRILASVI